MHWTNIQTDRWSPRKFDDYRPLTLYRQQSGLIKYTGVIVRPIGASHLLPISLTSDNAT